MISAWHLLWIIPLTSLISTLSIAITTANRVGDCDVQIEEPLNKNLNLRKREDDGKQDA